MQKSFGTVTRTLKKFETTFQRLLRTGVMNANSLVFVYGTLKTGEPNCEVMRNPKTGEHRLVGCARTVTRYPLLVASKYNIPFCLEQPGTGHPIRGEVYEVDDVKMNALDQLEAHPHFYRRQLQQVEMDSGQMLMAWIYLLPSWKPELLQEGSEFMDDYTSQGPHGRPYVDRYIREKRLKDDGKSLIEQVTGHSPK